MTATIAALISPETVTEVAGEVWSALVGEEEFLLPGPDADAPAVLGTSSWVAVTGPWNGLVVLTCSQGGTTELAREVLRLRDDEEPTEEDVDDVLRELANILGGNVKSLLPGPSALGLPQTGTPPAARPGSSTVAVSWRGHPIAITIQGVTEAPVFTTEVPQ